MSGPLLVFEGITAGYGGADVVRDVDLEVGAGEVVGLIGPNGSGKTTLVRVASRTLRPSKGRVIVEGEDPFELPARRAAQLVAVVPQDVIPVFTFTALEVALMGRSPYQSAWRLGSQGDWARVRGAMETTGVSDLAERPMETLSGGERRRVVLAQALAQDTAVLLLDEATTHLDLLHVTELLTVVRRLAAEGKAILAIYHDLNVAAASCDRLYAMSNGRVVAAGTPEEVITPALLEQVYGVRAEVFTNPVSGRPNVVPAVPISPGGAGPATSAPRPRSLHPGSPR